MNYSPLAVSPFYLYNIPMSGCKTELPQHKKALPNAQNPAKKNIREGVDMIATSAIILTAHSSQLTAHSSQRKDILFSSF